MEEKNMMTEEQLDEQMDEEIEKSGSSESKSSNSKGKKKTSSTKKSKVDSLANENEQLKKELQELRDNYLRLGAEFQNFRKRFEKEKEEIVLHANERLIELILPILDDFQRSISASEENGSFESLRDGVKLVYKNLSEALQKEGVKAIKSLGEQFDHNLHDALLMTEKEGAEPGTIIEEVMKGYYYKDKVIRHAKVIVAK
jgi:molecular chaperone GrpE